MSLESSNPGKGKTETEADKSPDSTVFKVIPESVIPTDSPLGQLRTMSHPPEKRHVVYPQRIILEQQYLDWIKGLSQDKLEHYDRIAFLFKELRIIFGPSKNKALPEEESAVQTEEGTLGRPENYALPGEEISEKQLSYEEIALLMEEITKEAREFLGKEPSDKLTIFYITLLSLKNLELDNIDIDKDKEFIKIAKRFFQLGIIKKKYLKLFSETTDDKTKEEIRLQIQSDIDLSERDLPKFIDALRVYKEIGQNVSRKDKASTTSETTEELLAKMCLSLKSISSLKRHVRSGDDKFGISEIIELERNFSQWPKDLIRGVKAYRTNQRSYWDVLVKTFNSVFPNQNTPVIAKHYRRIIRNRFEDYTELDKIIAGIKNKRQETRIRETLGEIAKALCYLEYMGTLQEKEQDNNHLNIAYPKRMLSLAYHICRKIELIGLTITWIAEQYRGPTTSNKNMYEMEYPLEDQSTESSQAGFTLPKNDNPLPADLMADNAEAVENALTSAPDIAAKLETVSMVTSANLNEAIKALEATECIPLSRSRVKFETQKPEDKPQNEDPQNETPEITAHYYYYSDKLTSHIDEFMTQTRMFLMMTIVGIANAFDNKHNSLGDIIPEYKEDEKQIVELRSALVEISKKCKETKQQIADLHSNVNNQEDDNPFLLKIKSTLVTLAETIRKFRKGQDKKIEEKNSLGLLKGNGCETMKKFSNIINEFILTRAHNKITRETIRAYASTTTLITFAANYSKKRKRGTENAPQWINTANKLKSSHNIVKSEHHINGGPPEELRDKYIQLHIQVIEEMKESAKTDKIVASFFKENPHITAIKAEDFNETFFAYQRILVQFEDFQNAISLYEQMIDQQLVVENDYQMATEIHQNINTLIEILTCDKSSLDTKKLHLALENCKPQIQKLESAAPSIAESLKSLLNYLYIFSNYVEGYKTNFQNQDFEVIIDSLEMVKIQLQQKFRISG